VRTYKKLEAAAKAYGAAHGVEGRPGGWIYRNGVAIVQGWRAYGLQLVQSGLIDPQDSDGRSVRRFVLPGEVRIMPVVYWRSHARQYSIKEEQS
jgi:hypothetical protein